ncbi:uncharacterized protein LOC100678603 [Nasonia vitripennis]|uniref:Coiled-coil domain-containing protein 51 n=1 Tax=Nasonia vitripennis TaxID=7425 RepID=A0A7M7HEL7_NASVI|nr:uncharacterized protein LOC100678603 [Nasonia vitripennis]
MAGNSRRVLKSLTEQINKSPLLFNASTAIGNATERAQQKISNLQNAASEKYVNIVKQVNDSTIIQDFNTAALQPSTPLPKRLVNYWQWYQQLTGMDKVELAKQQVIMVQDKLFKCQDQRRELTRQATSVNEKLKEIYSELIQTKRDDPKYVQLTILENKGLQEQTRITGQLTLLEGEERDHFTQLATAIKEYHDSQAMNAQKYKYLSILASALLAIVSLTGSMVYNNKRIIDVRNVITQAQSSMETNLNEKFAAILKRIEKQEKNITSALAIPGLTRISAASAEHILDHNTVEDDLPLPDIEKIKQTGYYLGIAVCTLYILQQIFRS